MQVNVRKSGRVDVLMLFNSTASVLKSIKKTFLGFGSQIPLFIVNAFMTSRVNGPNSTLTSPKLIRIFSKTAPTVGHQIILIFLRGAVNVGASIRQHRARTGPQIIIMVLLNAGTIIQLTNTRSTFGFALQNHLAEKFIPKAAFRKQSPVMINGFTDQCDMALNHTRATKFPPTWNQEMRNLLEPLNLSVIGIEAHGRTTTITPTMEKAPNRNQNWGS
jgi:hypothetical protein